MERDPLLSLKTPFFVVDRSLLQKNCELLKQVKDRSGVKILLALKGFAMFSTFELLRTYLDGSCASSVHEARLGKEEFGKEVHAFAAAYSDEDFAEISQDADHIVFNSMSQLNHFRSKLDSSKKYGLRINPEHSETETEIYDPCARFSRLGITRDYFPDQLPEEISGVHMHTLCEQSAEAFVRTFEAAEKKFSAIFAQCSWINLGGGHHITRSDYNLDLLCNTLQRISSQYEVELYLEPGEAVALNAGFLHTTVLDIMHNEIDIAIVDMSASAHVPDIIEMPFRPDIIASSEFGKNKYDYRIAGLSCLAGDIIGDYSFANKLSVGDRLVLKDMAHYSMVKTNTFNGIGLPSIHYYDSKEKTLLHSKIFGYDDFKDRLS